MQILLCGLVLLAAVAGGQAQCMTRDDTAINVTNNQVVYISSSHDFAVRLFQKLHPECQGRNLFFSPYSIWSALTLAFFGAEGDTHSEMAQAMGLTGLNKVDVMRAFRFILFWQNVELSDKIDDAGKNELRVANRLFFDRRQKVKLCMKELFHNEIEMVDFRKASEEARQTINAWVEEQTANCIKELVPPGYVDSNSRMVLVNAAYFKGTWVSQFRPNETQLAPFHSSKEDVSMVSMMQQEGTFNCGPSEPLQAQVLELPYLGHQISMYILLPFADSSLDVTISRLTPKILRGAFEFISPGEVNIHIPKFRVEEDYELSSVLSDLGFERLFNGSTADLSGFSKSGNMALGNALHKAFVEISEEGTEAAAATALLDNRSGHPSRTEQFICDRPFMYVIYYKPTHTMLFMGTYEHPDVEAKESGESEEGDF
ncbi:Serine protease inhibitor 88Ea [Amphibalanus amphitrite]|uniref:Serine protease inhibitor 88Ea n=1 Tax=Amphibalanus amphitrite TaxID=1232801 RepID=A0A6A4V777_AMPAM|nr:Serine protease inhibitor 88Ea [Amphibalanus amphitrite]